MAKYVVAGAGDEGGSRENPPVHSKGDRHGLPFHPAPVSRVGAVAAPPAAGVTHINVKAGEHVVTNHAPSSLGSAMAEGKHAPHPLSTAHTDIVSKAGTGQLDSKSYTGGQKGVAK